MAGVSGYMFEATSGVPSTRRGLATRFGGRTGAEPPQKSFRGPFLALLSSFRGNLGSETGFMVWGGPQTRKHDQAGRSSSCIESNLAPQVAVLRPDILQLLANVPLTDGLDPAPGEENHPRRALTPWASGSELGQSAERPRAI